MGTSSQEPNRYWLAVASAIISLVGLLTIPIPFIPSCFIGWVGALLAFISMRQMRGAQVQLCDRFSAVFGLVVGILPILALCGTFTYLLAKWQGIV